MSNATGAFTVGQEGDFLVDREGAFFETFGQEVDFFDHSRGRRAYDGPNRDISDLWVTRRKPQFATTGDRVFELVGWNKGGRPVPHSGSSLPRRMDRTQQAYLPNYIRPGDTFAFDFFFDKGGQPSGEGNTETTIKNAAFRFNFGVGGSYPEYGNHNLVRFDNSKSPPILTVGKETQPRGGYVHHRTIDRNRRWQAHKRYSVTVKWHKNGHFEAWVDGMHIDTFGTGNKQIEGTGIGFEVSSRTRVWIDSIRLVSGR